MKGMQPQLYQTWIDIFTCMYIYMFSLHSNRMHMDISIFKRYLGIDLILHEVRFEYSPFSAGA